MDTDKTVQNEELEANESENDNSTTESESSTQEERTYTESELNERLESERKERDKRWRERIKAASGEDGEKSHKENGEKSDSKESVASNEVILARLEARGILDGDIQNYLLDAAKREGKNAVDLLSDSYFTDKVAAMKKDKEQEAARPAPSSRTATNDRSNDLGYWIKQAEKGQLPPDDKMRRKVISHLSGRG